jgi:hypothetical protein
MSDLVKLRRQHVAWNIQQNPTQITVQRTTKTDMGGYFDEVISWHGPYTVRVFQEKSSIPQNVSTLAGTKQVDTKWGLLADHQADLQAGPNVKDEFDISDMGHFLVVGVYPQVVQGQIVGYQVDLERVG